MPAHCSKPDMPANRTHEAFHGDAKSFCVLHLPMLTEKQFERTITKLAVLLEKAFNLGEKTGKS